jgi:hypothetical protein
MKRQKPTIDSPAFKQYKKGDGFTYCKEWYDEDGKRKRTTITDEEYFQHLKAGKVSGAVKTEAPEEPVAAPEEPTPKVKKTEVADRCPRSQHDYSEPGEGDWQTCSKCGIRRRPRNGDPKPGMARYTYRY